MRGRPDEGQLLRTGAHVDQSRPTWRAAAPFVVVAALGLSTVALPPYYPRTALHLTTMLALFVVCLALLGVSLRRTRASWIDPAAPLLFFVFLMVGRDASGGATSGLAPLVALPILWVAITGTRWHSLAAAALTAVTFLGPLIVIGGPDYPASDWRRAMLWIAVAALVGPVVQRLVAALERERHAASDKAAELDSILAGARTTSLIATGPDGLVRTFSPGAQLLLGYAAEDVVGRLRPEAFHLAGELEAASAELGVDGPSALFAELARRDDTGRVWTYRRADGTTFSARVAVTDAQDSTGSPQGQVHAAIDVSAERDHLHELEVSEARWRVLMDHLPELTIIKVDEDLVIRVVAGAGAMRTKLIGSEGRHLAELSNPSNMQVIRQLIATAYEVGQAHGELNSTVTGAEHELVVAPMPVQDDGQRRALIVARDVSEKRAAERELLRTRDRAQRMFADAPYGVAVLSTEGQVLDVNSSMQALVGPPSIQMVGSRLAGLARPGDHAFEDFRAAVVAGDGERLESEWTMLDSQDREVHVTLSGRLLPDDEHGQILLLNVVDVSERRRYEQRLAHLADHDALTGLANRRQLDRELTAHLDQCERYGDTGALLLLDLDHFKEVNDTLGHGAGDQLIISTATLLVSCVRSTDVVSRLGGDEFAILLRTGDRAAAEKVAAMVVTRIRDHAATLDGVRRRVTASVGVVTMRAAREQSADILALADMTMYDAKDAGRDGHAVLEENSDRQPRSGARLEWKRRIEAALEDDGFVLELQPLLDLRTGRVRSAEALIRLVSGDELVPPGRFLYVAERSDLITRVDAWVIRRSIALLSRLRQVDPDFVLEVNVSGRSIGHPDIERAIVESLQEHDVEAEALVLEITETAAVSDVENARVFAERMTALGCKFALDDFGAGFGSFYYLKHLLFDYVKIDGEFVTNVHRSSIDRTILQSIVGIANGLGKRTVAEFVSTPEVLAVVAAEGCDFAQGYLIGEPIGFADFVERLAQGWRVDVPGSPARTGPPSIVHATSSSLG